MCDHHIIGDHALGLWVYNDGDIEYQKDLVSELEEQEEFWIVLCPKRVICCFFVLFKSKLHIVLDCILCIVFCF